MQGLPLSLSGVRRIMDNMDWGDALDFVSFGHVNPDQLDDADFYILVAPQNVVGSPIILNLIKMVRTLLVITQKARCLERKHITGRHAQMSKTFWLSMLMIVVELGQTSWGLLPDTIAGAEMRALLGLYRQKQRHSRERH